MEKNLTQEEFDTLLEALNSHRAALERHEKHLATVSDLLTKLGNAGTKMSGQIGSLAESLSGLRQGVGVLAVLLGHALAREAARTSQDPSAVLHQWLSLISTEHDQDDTESMTEQELTARRDMKESIEGIATNSINLMRPRF